MVDEEPQEGRERPRPRWRAGRRRRPDGAADRHRPHPRQQLPDPPGHRSPDPRRRRHPPGRPLLVHRPRRPLGGPELAGVGDLRRGRRHRRVRGHPRPQRRPLRRHRRVRLAADRPEPVGRGPLRPHRRGHARRQRSCWPADPCCSGCSGSSSSSWPPRAASTPAGWCPWGGSGSTPTARSPSPWSWWGCSPSVTASTRGSGAPRLRVGLWAAGGIALGVVNPLGIRLLLFPADAAPEDRGVLGRRRVAGPRLHRAVALGDRRPAGPVRPPAGPPPPLAPRPAPGPLRRAGR